MEDCEDSVVPTDWSDGEYWTFSITYQDGDVRRRSVIRYRSMKWLRKRFELRFVEYDADEGHVRVDKPHVLVYVKHRMSTPVESLLYYVHSQFDKCYMRKLHKSGQKMDRTEIVRFEPVALDDDDDE